MGKAFLILFFVFSFASIIGFIKPEAIIIWGEPERRTRMTVFGYFGQAAILFITLYIITVNSPDIDFSVRKTASPSASTLSVFSAGQGIDERTIFQEEFASAQPVSEADAD